jgi:hypothetical protein
MMGVIPMNHPTPSVNHPAIPTAVSVATHTQPTGGCAGASEAGGRGGAQG